MAEKEIDKELLDYVKSGISKGYPIITLRQQLAKEGWDLQEIDHAINSVGVGAESSVNEQAGPVPEDKEPIDKKTSKRPLPVTIIAILTLLGSLMMIGLGSMIVFFGGVVDSMIPMAGFSMVLGIIPIVIGVIGLIAFYFLFKMKRIGWLLVMIVGIVSIIQGILTSFMNNLVSIILWIIIIVYLFLKKDLFT